MTQATIRAAIVAAATGLVLAGCAEGTGPMAGDTSMGASDAADAPVARAAMPGRLVERDVEAPEVFQAADAALWDGRPSLGGVWVASPDAVDPERVIIRNPDNGNFVIGALFRRERLNPGPALQISSDAAAALGILAGAPTRIEVVALRRTEAAEPAPVAAEPAAEPAATETAAAEPAAPEPAAPAPAATDDIAAAAVAAIDRDAPAEAADPAAGAATELAAAAGVPAEPEPPRKKKRKWFWQKAPVEEAIPAALPADAAADAAVTAGPIAETALPAPGAEAAATPAPAAAPVAVAAPAPAGGALVQIGFFSVQENAQRAVDKLAGAGVSARILTEQAKGKTFWRVVAGPGADAAMLGKVKSAGFADAYFVRG